MKMLALAIILMSFPWVSHAGGWKHSNHDNHYQREHNNSAFWQDVKHRQYRQATRIERGIDKGQLTRREVKKLYREQKHVAKQIRYLSRHHYMSHANKRGVMEHLDFVSEKIRDLKHNDHYAHNRRFDHHGKYNHQRSTYNEHRDYRDDGYLSIANTDYSAGFYFKF